MEREGWNCDMLTREKFLCYRIPKNVEHLLCKSSQILTRFPLECNFHPFRAGRAIRVEVQEALHYIVAAELQFGLIIQGDFERKRCCVRKIKT